MINKLFELFSVTDASEKVAMTLVFTLKTASLFLCAYIAGIATSSESVSTFNGIESVFWSSSILFIIIYSALTTIIYIFKSIIYSKQTKELLGVDYFSFSVNYLSVFLIISGLGLLLFDYSIPYFAIGFFMISRLNSLEQIAIFFQKEKTKS